MLYIVALNLYRFFVSQSLQTMKYVYFCAAIIFYTFINSDKLLQEK